MLICVYLFQDERDTVTVTKGEKVVVTSPKSTNVCAIAQFRDSPKIVNLTPFVAFGCLLRKLFICFFRVIGQGWLLAHRMNGDHGYIPETFVSRCQGLRLKLLDFFLLIDLRAHFERQD